MPDIKVKQTPTPSSWTRNSVLIRRVPSFSPSLQAIVMNHLSAMGVYRVHTHLPPLSEQGINLVDEDNGRLKTMTACYLQGRGVCTMARLITALTALIEAIAKRTRTSFSPSPICSVRMMWGFFWSDQDICLAWQKAH